MSTEAKADPVRALIGIWENSAQNMYGTGEAMVFRGCARSLEAALAQQAGADRPVFCASFGFGGVAVSTAKFGDPAVPAVLLREVETVGVIGAPVEAGELRAALTFPTEDQAQRVFNSFTNAPQPAIPEGASPAPRNRSEAASLAKQALAYLGVIDAHIDAAIARCETGAQHNQESAR